MKSLIICLLLVFVFTSLICSSLVLAAPVDDYVKFKEEKYYLLDKQNFSKITCKVTVPIIDKMIESIRAQSVVQEHLVLVLENISDFTMTYTRGEGIKFYKPLFGLQIIAPERINDIESFKAGAEQMKKGFNQQVDVVINALQALFSEFMTPNNSKEKVTSFIKNGDETKATLEKEELSYEEIYKGTTRITNFKGLQFKGQSIDEFQDFGGHLMLATINTRREQQGIKLRDVMAKIDYQTVLGLNFPSKITITESQGLKQEESIEIILEDCSIQ